MNVRLLALLGAIALVVHTAAAVTTCPVSVQGRTTSTLADPITKVVADISSTSDNDKDDTTISPGEDLDLKDLNTGSQDSQNADVGSPSNSSSSPATNSSSDGASTITDVTRTGTDDSRGIAGGPATTTTPSTPTLTPPTTTTAPPSTPHTPSTTPSTSSSTTTPSTSTTPSSTTDSVNTPDTATSPTTSEADSATPSTATSTTATPASDSSGTGANAMSASQRKLQITTSGTIGTIGAVGTTAGTAGSTANTAAGTTASTIAGTTAGTIAGTTAGTIAGTTAGTIAGTTGTIPAATGSTGTPNTTGTTITPATGSITGPASLTNTTLTPSASNSSSTVDPVSANSTETQDLVCDSTFYSTWDVLGLKCGGVGINVASAVAASSCVIYSGSAGSTFGSTCVSICSFPSCSNNSWVYGAENGISSSVYDGLSVQSFLPSNVVTALEQRSSTVSTFLSNSTLSNSEQCTYSSENSFSSCSCSAMLVDRDSSGSVADAAKKELRASDEVNGVITKDNTTTAGQVVAVTSKSVAGVTVAITGIAAIASTAVGGISSAGASFAAAGSTMAITTVEICQFGVLVNQLQLEGKSSALAQFGKAMAPAAFTFLPFGKLSGTRSNSSSDGSSASSSSGRRLEDSNSNGEDTDSNAKQLSGIETYSRQLDIHEDMLFLVTLAGVFCVMACVVGLFGVGYLLSGVMMSREEYLEKFFDKMIGLEVLVAILSQYTIGVTATFQIYYSTKYESITDPKCLLAIAAILFLASGILVYGYFVIKKHEADIKDVGTVQHMKKIVNMRYGPLYEEYKFKNRYFFAAKMMLALTTGVVTGCAGMSGKAQVSIILAINVLFFFYLEIQSPHHSKFVQTTTSFVSIMKIAVLVLTFFLVTAASSDGFPTSLQNGISVAIVGLNLFVLALLMIRSLYTFWQKLKLQRDAAYDQEEQTTQEYFKDETPAQYKDRALSNAQLPGGQSVLHSQYTNGNNHSPYVQNNAAADYNIADEIRLHPATHEKNDRQQIYDASRSSAANHYITQNRNVYDQRRDDVVEL